MTRVFHNRLRTGLLFILKSVKLLFQEKRPSVVWHNWMRFIAGLFSHRVKLIHFADVKPSGTRLAWFWHGLGIDHNQKIYVAIGNGAEASGGVGDVHIFRYDTKNGSKIFLKSVSEILKDEGNLGPNKHWPKKEGVSKVHSDIIEHNGIMYFSTHDHHTAESIKQHRGGHLLSYDLGTGAFRNLSRFCPSGVAIVNEGIIGLNILKQVQTLVGWTFPYGHILLHDLTTGVTTKCTRGLSSGSVTDVARIVITTRRGSVFCAYTGKNAPLNLFKLDHVSKRLLPTQYKFDRGFLEGLAETSDGKTIYIADTDGQLYALDADTEELKRLGSILPPERESRGERILELRNLTMSIDERKLFAIPTKTNDRRGAYRLYEYDIETGTKSDLGNMSWILSSSMLTGNGVMDESGCMYISCYFGSDHKMYERYGELSGIVRIDVSDRLMQTASIPIFQPYGGHFTDSTTVSLSTNTPGAQIRYTVDGSDVHADSPLYTVPLLLDSDTYVKARSFKDGLVHSQLACALFHKDSQHIYERKYEKNGEPVI